MKPWERKNATKRRKEQMRRRRRRMKGKEVIRQRKWEAVDFGEVQNEARSWFINIQ